MALEKFNSFVKWFEKHKNSCEINHKGSCGDGDSLNLLEMVIVAVLDRFQKH